MDIRFVLFADDSVYIDTRGLSKEALQEEASGVEVMKIVPVDSEEFMDFPIDRFLVEED